MLAVAEFLLGSGILVSFIILIFKIGEFNNRFCTLEKEFDKQKDDLKKFISDARDWYKEVYTNISDHNTRLSIMEVSQAHSPIVLKDAFMPFITTPKIDEQVKAKMPELLKWLKAQKPATGLDAQDKIIELVTSGEIEKYLELSAYKQNLYEKGKTSQDVGGILAVYLFQTLIPQLKFKKK